VDDRSSHAADSLWHAFAVPFSQDDLELIDRTKLVRIETSRVGGPTHRTTVWVVVDDGHVFVRSAYGPDARWYREATTNPGVTMWVGEQPFKARVTRVTDPDEIARMSAGLERKYAGDPAVRQMIRPELLPLTLRLDPA
jgi:hypothetical protein